MEGRGPAEEQKIEELWAAYKSGGLAGIKEVLSRRDEEWLKEKAPQEVGPPAQA